MKKMQMKGRLAAVILVLSLLLGLLTEPVSVLAAEGNILKVTVNTGVNDNPVEGLTYDLYRIADVAGDTIVLLPEYKVYEDRVSWSENTAQVWKSNGEVLAACVKRNNHSPLSEKVTDDSGEVVFGKDVPLPDGLYLITGQAKIIGTEFYSPEPVLVLLSGNSEALIKSKLESVPAGEKINLKVRKIWMDEGYKERPASVRVELIKDGAIFDVVELNKDNNWYHEWKDLSSDAAWVALEEDIPEDYIMHVEKNGEEFRIINVLRDSPPEEPQEPTPEPQEPTPEPQEPTPEPQKPTPEPQEPTPEPQKPTPEPKTPEDEPKLPQTGQLNWPIPVLAGLGFLSLIYGMRKRRYEEKKKQ